METARLEAFSDGVFAIAATLLIIDVGVDTADRSLESALLHSWPSYAAYAVSFLTIGIMWVNHHAVLAQVGRADRAFLFLNIGLLLGVAFVPFPTRLVAEFIRTDDARAAALAYGITLTVTAFFFSGVWFYAALGRRLLRRDVDSRVVSGITRSFLPGPWIYLGSTLVAFASPVASALLYAGIALFYVIESSLFGREET